jgi:hypothetical protein
MENRKLTFSVDSGFEVILSHSKNAAGTSGNASEGTSVAM